MPSSLPSTSDTEVSHDDHSPRLQPITEVLSHISEPAGAPIQQYESQIEIPDAVYDRFSSRKKLSIVAILSLCSFLTPVGSTAVLSAIPEVAAEYDSTGSIIDLTNALYLVFMGISPCFWGPLSQVYGRRIICLISVALFFGCCVGTALSPNLASFFVFRILTAFEGTSFLIVGASCLGDIYRPTERGTAMGWFFSGTLIGPALGPFIGGIIVTYTSWRVIFWLQAALAGVATIGAFFLLPETAHHKKADDLVGLPLKKKMSVLWEMCSPFRVIKLFRYPSLTFVALASSSLLWNMYSLLTPIRYSLNPRFNLNSPIQGGLFYLAPGGGYLLGTFFGGRYADYITKKYIAKRGVRIPEDRLRSALPFMGVIIPISMLIYGWSVQKRFGGIPLPVIMMFIQGFAQLFCFPSLNTYCLDVLQGHGAEVIAGNYMLRYLFGAIGTATVLPAIDKIGVGWWSTISAAFLVAGTLTTYAAVRWGSGWREKIDKERRAKRQKKAEDSEDSEKEKNTVATTKSVMEPETV